MSIDQLFPTAREELTDEQLLTLYAPRTADDGAWLRMNFVTSLDGAVAVDGVSGSLGGPGDFRVFELQRYLADVVLVGAGTVRDEGYGAMVLPQEATRWRADHGLTDHPVFALISGSADLSPESETFSQAPVRPLVFVSADADEARRDALAEVADVVIASVPGGAAIDPRIVRAHLVSRGLTRIHSEGGPRVFGSFLEAGVVDELCLTMAPKLLGGRAGRISASESSVPTHMDLASVLRSEDELLLRYIRT